MKSSRISKRQIEAGDASALLARTGEEIRMIDQTLFACVARRVSLAPAILAAKTALSEGGKVQIVNREREQARLQEAGVTAASLGVDTNLALAIEYFLIGELVKSQAALAGKAPPQAPDRAQLRQNLLALTASVAPTYSDPNKTHGTCPVTQEVRRFESAAIADAIRDLEGDRALLVDVGCANGQELFRHVRQFRRGLGLDLCGHMIEAAIATGGKLKLCEKKSAHPASFVHVDVEETGVPVRDGEVSFAIVNNGTGSDFFDLRRVLGEIARALRPGGRFFASFYNADAAAAQGVPLPWTSAMRATPDRDHGTVQVRTADGRVHEVPGRAYSRREVERAMPAALQVLSATTFPFSLSLMPSGVLTNNRQLRATLARTDRALAKSGHEGGAYLMVTGVKI